MIRPKLGISFVRQANNLTASRAVSWIEAWRILEFFKVVLVGPVPDSHLGRKTLKTFSTVLPRPGVRFVEVASAQGKAGMLHEAFFTDRI